MKATYDPSDNKLRIYPVARLDPEAYARVKAAGFIWAPKQELFVAPAWSPAREDLAIELCGEIGDEDISLVERAEERAERFEDYSEKRESEANRAHEAVAAIADNISLGQPILCAHHSEKRARKDAERIENGMRRAVNLWETSKYWEQRAQGAIRNAKYKERSDVRVRRIKTLGADKRKYERNRDQAKNFLSQWEKWESLKRKDGTFLSHQEAALLISNYDWVSRCYPLSEFPRNPPASQYEGDMSLYSALTGGVVTSEQAREIAQKAHGRSIPGWERWIAHFENRIAYEKAMLAESGGTVADRTGPGKGGACVCWASPGRFEGNPGWSYIVKVNKVSVSVLVNWGNGGGNFSRTMPFDKLKAIMTAAEVQAARDAGTLVETATKIGFFLIDAKPPAPKPEPQKPAEVEKFENLKKTLDAGVQVVTANCLFPTPSELAGRMVELADIQPLDRVLEPSAGTGKIAVMVLAVIQGMKAGGRLPATLETVEINTPLAAHLNSIGCNCRQADFITLSPEPFDRIVMNPPFDHGSDIEHILHALDFLREGGRLVAICANGPKQNETLKTVASTWEVLPRDTFEGTSVSAVLLTIDK